ncbi:hypothetical protein, partial [Bacillus paralicheniformis]
EQAEDEKAVVIVTGSLYFIYAVRAVLTE